MCLCTKSLILLSGGFLVDVRWGWKNSVATSGQFGKVTMVSLVSIKRFSRPTWSPSNAILVTTAMPLVTMEFSASQVLTFQYQISHFFQVTPYSLQHLKRLSPHSQILIWAGQRCWIIRLLSADPRQYMTMTAIIACNILATPYNWSDDWVWLAMVAFVNFPFHTCSDPPHKHYF